eukprot:CAMPEP_0172446106 /NCGR_PEP_ID=MMETSP1065-20121228/5781_1 /TAXON_ID=265537 /ORGANISM="Amphiprora paludosa, Strain CCMP125" /LENGTH=486 /DNA_ID=CAMNT_0013197145 /DNA_START=12 /DNA_END=1472 /DNA_ORIENTATION=+
MVDEHFPNSAENSGPAVMDAEHESPSSWNHTQHSFADVSALWTFDALDVLICLMLAVFIWFSWSIFCRCCCRRRKSSKQDSTVVDGDEPLPPPDGQEDETQEENEEGGDGDEDCTKADNGNSNRAPQMNLGDSADERAVFLKKMNLFETPSRQDGDEESKFSTTLSKSQLKDLMFEAMAEHASSSKTHGHQCTQTPSVMHETSDEMAGVKRLETDFEKQESPSKRLKTGMPFDGEYVRVRVGADQEEVVALKILPQPRQPQSHTKLVLIAWQGNNAQELVEESAILGPVKLGSQEGDMDMDMETEEENASVIDITGEDDVDMEEDAKKEQSALSPKSAASEEMEDNTKEARDETQNCGESLVESHEKEKTANVMDYFQGPSDKELIRALSVVESTAKLLNLGATKADQEHRSVVEDNSVRDQLDGKKMDIAEQELDCDKISEEPAMAPKDEEGVIEGTSEECEELERSIVDLGNSIIDSLRHPEKK